MYLAKKLFHLLYTVNLGLTSQDKINILLYFSLPRTTFIPIKFLPNLYLSIWKKLYKKFPKINLKSRYGTFLCRERSIDLLYLSALCELDTTNTLLSLLKSLNENHKEFVFVDIGAHIGRYTVMVGRIIEGKVIAIEPEPSNFNALKTNVELNNLSKKVFLINKAAWNRKGIVKLNLEELKGSGGHSIVISKDYSIKVKCDKLDNLVKNICSPKKIKLIKIDVEGAEPEVLEGAKKILKYKPIIIFEAWNKERLRKVLKILYKFDYKNIKRIEKWNYVAF